MIEEGGSGGRDLAALMVSPAGRMVATGDRYEPYRVLAADETRVEPVTEFFRDLLAAGRAAATAGFPYNRGDFGWADLVLSLFSVFYETAGAQGLSRWSLRRPQACEERPNGQMSRAPPLGTTWVVEPFVKIAGPAHLGHAFPAPYR